MTYDFLVSKRVCVECGGQFEIPRRRGRPPVTCSEKCRAARLRKRPSVRTRSTTKTRPHKRGDQSDWFLKLSHDRKVSPRGIYQESRDRWVPTIPNSFGLPAGISCPGKTDFCESCYALSSERSHGVGELVEHNMRLLEWAGTADRMTDLLDEMVSRYVAEAYRRDLAPDERIFRIHWDGDFFSLDYAVAWARVIHDTPDVQFWAYTRSFVPPANVVPVLVGIPNLSLYLSADAWNIDAARGIISEYPEVRLAVCAVDYRTGRGIAPDRRPVICPENNGGMPLMADGRGACVDCGLCVHAKRDVMFSTSHREDATTFVTSSIALASGRCQNPECGAMIGAQARGAKRKFCSERCRLAMAYRRRAS